MRDLEISRVHSWVQAVHIQRKAHRGMSDKAKIGGDRDTAAARSGNKDESRLPTKKKKACSTCARLTGVLEKFKAAMDPLAERAKRGNACLVREKIAVCRMEVLLTVGAVVLPWITQLTFQRLTLAIFRARLTFTYEYLYSGFKTSHI